MIKHALKLVWMLAVLCGVGCTHAPRQPETILFVGNSFTYGALSSVQHYRPETVIDLNQDGMGGVPALFESFARQAGLHYSARLASLFRSKNPHVDVRLVATWSRADQTFLPSGHWFGKPIEAMAQDLRAACDRAAENSPSIRAVVPPAHRYYLEALVIFGSVTGRDPRALGREEIAAAQLGIAPAEAVALQQIALETLANESDEHDSRWRATGVLIQ